MELSERKQQILKAIIAEYIRTAEPVGSKALAALPELSFSSATIRNEMSELEEMGYLEKPHTSAGRVPSHKGYRFYVDHLMRRPEVFPAGLSDQTALMTLKEKELDRLIQEAGRLISSLTDYAAVAVTPHLSRVTIRQFELIPVNDTTYVIVILTDANVVKNKLVHTAAPVTTLPSVVYEIVKTEGTTVMIDNPHEYPDPAVIDEAREPFVKASIITPQEFVGNIMPMCQERRSVFKDMQYLDTNLVELHYEMPINEIIYDFFDALKARTKGYASLDYELSDYRKSDLVKVDMLLNGDQVDALSFIAHREKAYGRARRICEKLKENIPRQLFEIPIQAAIGGKVIARETVKAVRKDVLAKCYGGDITRKKKLLEKQKEGKKRMRTLGTVQVPSEAFMAVLKLDEE